jgi:predicted O-linked N-acetylglucosamine transferase (SPINDLY family)
LGRLDEAVTSFHKALNIQPDYANAHYNLGNALQDLGKLDEAVASFHKALAIKPDYAKADSNLGVALQKLGKLDEAVASYRKAIALKPDYAEAHSNLGVALQKLGKLDEAVTSHRKALAINPDYAEAHNNLGFVLYELGNLDDAVDSYRKALSIKPNFANAHSNLLLTMSFMSCFDGAAVFAEACRAGTVFESPFADRRSTRHANNPDPNRPLNVGYLSPSLTEHVLSSYLEPVFKVHRRDRVSVHVYAHVSRPDDTTWRIKELADSWTFVHGLTDDQVAERIIEDGIDILVDPMGHWSSNRLSVFARKPAPIQVSYLCQNLTTGLSKMDYVIGDRWLNEGGVMQNFATERVVELDGGFQTTSYDHETPIGEVPSVAAGFVNFASFNNPAKISDASLKLWAAVLDHVSEARLLIKGKWLDRPEKRAFLSKRLEEHGIPAERTDLRGFVLEGDHLEVHNLVDIALDTVPFTGGRTTVDALWMGVPVVTLIGDTVYGRFSYSHLARTGVPELAAKDEAGFIDIAAALAGDPDRLGHYRQTLRPALQASSLLDAHQHTAELEDAFRVMWRRWCDGLEPEAFNGFDKSGP